MDDEAINGQPVIRVGGEGDRPSPSVIRKAKRDINRNWRQFWENRGIDPNKLGVEYGFKQPPGRPRKNARRAEGDDHVERPGDRGDDLPSVGDAAMD